MDPGASTGDSIHASVADARRRLNAAGLAADDAALDARLLAQHVLGWDTARLLMSGGDRATPAFTRRYTDLLERRLRHEPLAYITGTKEFWGLDFEVTPDVLIPRPETELIVEETLSRFPDSRSLTMADVCTGSGCIAVAVAHERARARIVATDTSTSALRVAERNAGRHHVADRIRFLEGDLLDGVEGAVDLIVSNPPYVPDRDRTGLQAEVRDFEPPAALFAGPFGLDVIERLIAQAADHLHPGGLLIFELGMEQDTAAARLISGEPRLTMERVARDLQGIPRVAIATRVNPHA